LGSPGVPGSLYPRISDEQNAFATDFQNVLANSLDGILSEHHLRTWLILKGTGDLGGVFG
jgi:hypothetical protein